MSLSSLSGPRRFHYPLPVLVKRVSPIILKPMEKTREHNGLAVNTHPGTHKLFMHSQTLNAKHTRMVDDLLVAGGQKEEGGGASLFLPITKYLSVKDSRLGSVRLLTILNARALVTFIML